MCGADRWVNYLALTRGVQIDTIKKATLDRPVSKPHIAPAASGLTPKNLSQAQISYEAVGNLIAARVPVTLGRQLLPGTGSGLSRGLAPDVPGHRVARA